MVAEDVLTFLHEHR